MSCSQWGQFLLYSFDFASVFDSFDPVFPVFDSSCLFLFVLVYKKTHVFNSCVFILIYLLTTKEEKGGDPKIEREIDCVNVNRKRTYR